MSGCCHGGCAPLSASTNRRFRRALWIALIANAVMFLVEAGASWRAESTALLADAIDFLGDSANYAVSLMALAAGAVWRSRVALAKGWTMAGYGVLVLAVAAFSVARGAQPEPMTMATVGFVALLVNASVAVLLYAFRDGDANMRSVWLCSRNDAIGNVAVMLAAAGVFGSGTIWPDVGVAVLLGGLSLSAARSVITHARAELERQSVEPAPQPAVAVVRLDSVVRARPPG
ncbi:MAG: cation transporter [Burkholderiaceae bacterium]